jgi:hypothetical protein
VGEPEPPAQGNYIFFCESDVPLELVSVLLFLFFFFFFDFFVPWAFASLLDPVWPEEDVDDCCANDSVPSARLSPRVVANNFFIRGLVLLVSWTMDSSVGIIAKSR